MIKYLNNGEIGLLKEGFYNTLALKKINMMDIDKFMKKELDLNSAINIYKLIIELKRPECYQNYSLVMLEYLLLYNLLDEDNFNKITSIFYNDSDFRQDQREVGYYYDKIAERYIFISEFFNKICSDNKIKIVSADYKDILFNRNSIDLSIFEDIRIALRQYVDSFEFDSEYTDEDIENEYYEIFQDDTNSYVLVDFEIKQNQLSLLNDTFIEEETGLGSGEYTRSGNTYIDITGIQVLEGIGYKFFIALIIIFMNKT